jgi:hypothetical protein
VDRAAAGRRPASVPAAPPGLPTVDPPLADLQRPAGSLWGEPLGEGLVDQPQQRSLCGGLHAREDAASQRDLPRSKASSIACSLTVSPSLAISARAAASSASSRPWRALAGRPPAPPAHPTLRPDGCA